MIVFGDIETFSERPIKHGHHAYAADPTTEVIMSQWAVDDGPVRVEEGLHPDFVRDLERADKVVFHNAPFDATVLRHKGVKLDDQRLHCTMAQAYSHGLPGSLDAVCAILGVEEDKRKREGKALVQLFCKPRPKNSKIRRATKFTHPQEWAAFLLYGGADVVAMRELFARLPGWNYPRRQREIAVWRLDQRINNRGFAVDVDFARAALDTGRRAARALSDAAKNATNGRLNSTLQRNALLDYLAGVGVNLPDLTKSTLERALEDEDVPWSAKELIRIRLAASKTSITKYRTLLDAVSPDGRLRGSLQYCGAARTGRWGGRLFQPQNLPRPLMKADEIEKAIELTKSGALDLLYPARDHEGEDWPNVFRVLSDALRGSIIAAPGHKLVVSDLSNIEGRVLAWLAGEDWKLEAFARFDRGEGPDLYKVTAGRILRKRPEDVTKDERQTMGKVPELACGFQGAAGAFATMGALYGVSLPAAQVEQIVTEWRAAHPATRAFWYGIEGMVKDAIRSPGVTTSYRRIKAQVSGKWLRVQLPSGRMLVYARPQLREVDGWPDTICYEGVHPYTRQWKMLTTYGGKLTENIVQAVARDVMAEGALRAEAAGYRVVLTVHDELITEVPDTGEFTSDRLSAILATNAEWNAGLPLAAAGFEARRYRKDG